MTKQEKNNRLNRAMKRFQRLAVLVHYAGDRLTIQQAIMAGFRLGFIRTDMDVIASQPTRQ